MRNDRLSQRLGLVAVVVALSAAMAQTAMTQEGPPGITRPVVFPPFNPDARRAFIEEELQTPLQVRRETSE